ncbi:MAG TPA: hypothetical protein DD490_11235 [Acidobacteria bacterium]|nr:hypothetical protein [Acidobacteriota bacterium]
MVKSLEVGLHKSLVTLGKKPFLFKRLESFDVGGRCAKFLFINHQQTLFCAPSVSTIHLAAIRHQRILPALLVTRPEQ